MADINMTTEHTPVVFHMMSNGSMESQNYYNDIKFIINKIETYFGLFAGVALNLMAAIVFRRPNLRNNSISLYLFYVALSDLLYSFTKNMNNVIQANLDFSIARVNNYTCKIWWFVQFSSRMASALLLTCVTIERFISVYFPTRVKLICKPSFPKFFIAVIIIVSMGLNVSHLIFDMVVVFKDEEGKELSRSCKVYDYYGAVNIYHEMILGYLNFILYSFGPAIIMTLCSLGIIVKLTKASAIRQQLTPGASHESKVSSATIMLVVNAMAFVFLTLPVVIYQLLPIPPFDLKALAEGQPDYHGYYKYELILTFLSSLITVNHSINFLLYCISGSIFRNEFITLFAKQK
jgi:hypothetical protein